MKPIASPTPAKSLSRPLKVQLFAAAAEAAGRGEIELSLTPPATASQVLGAIAQQYPALATIAARSRIAVDHRFVREEDLIVEPIASVAMIPPVSGG